MLKLRNAFAPSVRPPSNRVSGWAWQEPGLRGIDMWQIDSLERGRTRLVLYIAQEAPTGPFIRAVGGTHRTARHKIVQVNKKGRMPRLSGSFVKKLIVQRQHYAPHSLIEDLRKAGLITSRQSELLMPEYFTPDYKRRY